MSFFDHIADAMDDAFDYTFRPSRYWNRRAEREIVKVAVPLAIAAARAEAALPPPRRPDGEWRGEVIRGRRMLVHTGARMFITRHPHQNCNMAGRIGHGASLFGRQIDWFFGRGTSSIPAPTRDDYRWLSGQGEP